eukprot:UN14387
MSDSYQRLQEQHMKTLAELKETAQKINKAARESECFKHQMKAEETVKLQAFDVLQQREDKILKLSKELEVIKP